MQSQYIETLLTFLNTPLENGDEIFARFAALPGAVAYVGEKPLQRYVYIPGRRKDRVVLVAHMDTVWDQAYDKKPFSGPRGVLFENGIFKSNNPDCGIGADDRAGCAMLWFLLSCGHSILVTDGEEYGKHGAKYLKNHNKKLYRELNYHRYMIEFDWKGTDGCLFNQVDNTEKFKKYIDKELGFVDSKASGGTDLGVLCQKICGVNLGIGYQGWHTNRECLVLSDWENTLNKVRGFLERPQPKFPTRAFPRYVRFVKRCVKKVLKILPKKS